MYGAVCGDIIGSYYERHCTKDYNCSLCRPESHFTDDTVMTAAVCDAVLYNAEPIKIWELSRRALEYAQRFKAFYTRYPHAGFGKMFQKWAKSDILYHQRSFGNGGAMRAVPIGYAYEDLAQVQLQAHASCLYTHRHPEAIRGAKAVASAVFLARHGSSKMEIQRYLEKQFHYQLNMDWEYLHLNYVFDSHTSYSVPPAIQSFLISSDYEDCIRKAISLGGDADTMACIAGGIAEAYYGSIPAHILQFCKPRTDRSLRDIFDAFQKNFAEI